MNKQLHARAMRTRTADDQSRLVLATLARFSNAQGETGIRLGKLAALTALPESSVAARIESLSAGGFITTRRGRRGTVYQINLPSISA